MQNDKQPNNATNRGFTRRNHERAKDKRPSGDSQKQRQPFGGKQKLFEVIKVRLTTTNRLIEVNVCDKRLMPKTHVLVRVRRNMILAETVGHRYRVLADPNNMPFVVRLAEQSDFRIHEENQEIVKRAISLATRFAFDHKLAMKVLSADLSHDKKNITINFASDVRVDFREMVSFLASNLNLRIEMFQLGLRNGTGLLCGLGSCGQQLCCGRFLSQFEPVAVKLLRAQGLAGNPKRISGVCGRLYCCLSYEYYDYVKSRRNLPKQGRRVLTRWGYGVIVDNDFVRDEVIIGYDNGETQRLTIHDFVLLSEEADLAQRNVEDMVFPLEPMKFFLNSDPSAACILTQEQTAAKSHSKPRVQAVPKPKRGNSGVSRTKTHARPDGESDAKTRPTNERLANRHQRSTASKRSPRDREEASAAMDNAPSTPKQVPRRPKANKSRSDKLDTRPQTSHQQTRKGKETLPPTSVETSKSEPSRRRPPRRGGRRPPSANSSSSSPEVKS